MPGGFHPFHAGHKALYDAAVAAFPSADVYVAATADTNTRPFPFEVKQKLARLAGIPAHRFIQVKSPFSAQEITQMYDPDEGRLIILPTFRGKQGNPMLWDRRYFAEILAISGDSGARFLVGKHAEAVVEVEMADDGVLRDFDTTESLATLPPRMRPAGV